MSVLRKHRRQIWACAHVIGIVVLLIAAVARASADETTQLQTNEAQIAEAASVAFAENCFSPFMTADRATEVLGGPGVRVDFYDLDPFSDAEPSPVTGRAATTGTDRRCEVAFDGDHGDLAASAAIAGLEMEGIRTEAPVPDRYRASDATTLLGARQLNPRRIAVVHVGTRPGPNGIETFMFVERLMPLEVAE